MSGSARMPGSDDEVFARERRLLVREIEAEVRLTRRELRRDRLDPRVRAALVKVPRHEFVPEHLRKLAYSNEPLPLGHGQTISQPYIVAVMTDLLRLDGDERVLEIGTGSGYQAAVLAELAGEVYSIEVVEPLGLSARATLERLGYGNVHLRVGDGYSGWPEAAPFDGIIVTAAAPEPPAPLVEQLATGGRMVIPVDAGYRQQELRVIRKDASGELKTTGVLPVAFVPFTGGH